MKANSNSTNPIMLHSKRNPTIQERCMLAKLNVSRWTASREDRRVSEDVAQRNNSEVAMGRFVKRLVVKQALKAIQVVTFRARHYHYDHTLPWGKDGARILSAKNFFEYEAEMNKFKRQFEREVAKFVADYDGYVRDAQRRLGSLFDAGEYPTQPEVAGLFKFAFDINPLPDAKDFRVDLGEEKTQEIRDQIKAQVDESVKEAMTDVWRRIHDQVAHLTERLKGYGIEQDGSIRNPFRDATIENVRELVDLLPRLNITNDPELVTMAKRLDDELCRVEPATLRQSAVAREDVAAKADQILKDVSEVIG